METPILRPPAAFYRVSLKAVIRDAEGRILVVKEGDATAAWSLPGGGWDHGETEREALARELYEEVSYSGEFESALFATLPIWYEMRQCWLLWLVYNITVSDLDKNKFSIGVDANDMAWMYPADFKDIRTHGGQWIFTNL